VSFSNTYTVGFAGVVCVLCSLAVASAAIGLRDLQQQNVDRDLKNNILQALSVVQPGEPIEGERIDQLWDERVRIAVIDATGAAVEAPGPTSDKDQDGDVDLDDVALARVEVKGTERQPELLAVYQRIDDGNITAHGIPVYGKGLWGPLSGYLAVDATGTEITGATFFAPKETPGLGAEITMPKFKAQWIGKKLVRDGKSEPVRVAKGKATDAHADELDYWVDGVSGSTITCRGVTAMVEQGVAYYDPYLSSLRNQ
jgi:Na+-transporting NADH:ubiquinone oxidoreductase subunit C